MKLENFLAFLVTISCIGMIFSEKMTPCFLTFLLTFCICISLKSKNFGDWIRIKKVNLPAKVGGFVSVLFPNTIFLNPNWNRLPIKDAELHEKTHLDLLFRKFYIFPFLISGNIVWILTRNIFVFSFYSALFLTLFEYITNREARKKFGIILEPKNKLLYYSMYLILYFLLGTVITSLVVRIVPQIQKNFGTMMSEVIG